MKPNPNAKFPKANIEYMTNIKATVEMPNIVVGDFSYYTGTDFESRVTHHYDWIGDKLIIGKFCQIGANVEFIMNGANHQMNAISTFPFYVMHGWKQDIPKKEDMPYKGDTIIGNDVWIGQNVTIMPGVKIGDGAIIGASSVVSKDIPAYSIAAGNPCKVKIMRFDDETINVLEQLKWWDKAIEEIQELIPLITSSNINIEQLKKYIK